MKIKLLNVLMKTSIPSCW